MKFLLGIVNWTNDNRDKYDGRQTDRTQGDTTKLNRKESYKAQRKNYRREKKRVASELLNSLQDPAVIVLADWLKIRGTLKSWTKLWCVLKPGLLLLYKTPKIKSSHWVGTILITSCQVIERPSKKDGFCFKLFHPLEQSIWAPRGPDKETIGAVVQPLPTSYLIFRAPSQAAGKCWMDALELSLRCSGLLLRSNSACGTTHSTTAIGENSISHETQWSEADYEKHFKDQGNQANLNSTLQSGKDFKIKYLFESLTSWKGHNRNFEINYALNNSDSSEMISNRSSICGTNKFSLEWPNRMQFPLSADKFVDSKRKLNFISSCNIRQLEIPIITIRPASAPPDLDNDSQNEAHTGVVSGVDSDSESDANEGQIAENQTNEMDNDEDLTETPYMPALEEELNDVAGEQVEELAEENKSLIWCLLKQVRPGMDLSKVVLPTFILEPRSFLDKLSDSYYHADILSRAVTEDDPLDRIKFVVKWYLSGFYKKPKGLKKPYNPILGESFRCYWEHPNGSRTYYLAEQVSHHPPVTAFYVTNRQEGFCISCSILAKSKFYGNSTSAVLDGVATLTLLPRGEIYTLTTPYAHCKGILMGTLSMELGGKVNIDCENTGYKTELEFKLKPFLGGSDNINVVSGKLKLCKETLATINGHWDGTIYIKDIKNGEESVLFAANTETKEQRLKRYTVPMEMQLPNESERLWNLVSAAIRRDDQVGATEEKTVLEEIQRKLAKERKAKFIEWQPAYFLQDVISGKWIYKYSDLRPWDPRNDVKQYEVDYKILTKTKHQAPIVRTTSTVSVVPTIRRGKSDKLLQSECCGEEIQSDSSQSIEYENGDNEINEVISPRSIRKLQKAVDQVNKTLDENVRQLTLIHKKLERLQYMPMSSTTQTRSIDTSLTSISNAITQNLPQALLIRCISYIAAAIALNYFLKWLLYN